VEHNKAKREMKGNAALIQIQDLFQLQVAELENIMFLLVLK